MTGSFGVGVEVTAEEEMVGEGEETALVGGDDVGADAVGEVVGGAEAIAVVVEGADDAVCDG